MATCTSIKSGNWADASTWDNGVPAGDAVIIVAGHTVVANGASMSASSITVNGVLALPTAPGSYVLNCSGNIKGSGQITGGTSTVPIPATVDFQFQFTTTSGKFTGLSNAGGGIQIFGTQPTLKYAQVAVAALQNDKTIYASGDLTEWANYIANLPAGRGKCWITVGSTQGQSGQEYTISSIGAYDSANDRTPIMLLTGLGSAIPILYSYIVLTTRNVLIQSSTSAYLLENINNCDAQACELRSVGGQGVRYGSGHNVGGSAFVGHYYGTYANTGVGAIGTVFAGVTGIAINSCGGAMVAGAVFVGNPTALSGSHWSNAAGTLFAGNGNGIVAVIGCNANGGIFVGNQNATNANNGLTAVGARFAGNVYAIYLGNGVFRECAFEANSTIDVRSQRDCTLINCTFTPGKECNYSSDKPYQQQYFRTISYNDSGVPGAIRSWVAGGSTIYPNADGNGTHPVFGSSHKASPSDSGYYAWYDSQPIRIRPGYDWCAVVWVRQMQTGMASRPEIQLVDTQADPYEGGTALFTQQIADNTGWQEIQLRYHHSDALPKSVKIRVQCKGSSGTVYFGMAEVQANRHEVMA